MGDAVRPSGESDRAGAALMCAYCLPCGPAALLEEGVAPQVFANSTEPGCGTEAEPAPEGVRIVGADI